MGEILFYIAVFICGFVSGMAINAIYFERKFKRKLDELVKLRHETSKKMLELKKRIDEPIHVEIKHVRGTLSELFEEIFKLDKNPIKHERLDEQRRKDLMDALKKKNVKFNDDATLEELEKLWDLFE